ncbi:hypothetical protein [Nocardioides pacificus]
MTVNGHVDVKEVRMTQQTIRQQARRAAREMAGKRRKEREQRERRVIDLVERVMVAISERDAAVAETEKRAGEALQGLVEREGLSLGEAVEWCGEAVTLREAARLRRMASEPEPDGVRVQGGTVSGLEVGDAAAVGGAASGGVGAGS